jgi:hypothetical protein
MHAVKKFCQLPSDRCVCSQTIPLGGCLWRDLTDNKEKIHVRRKNAVNFGWFSFSKVKTYFLLTLSFKQLEERDDLPPLFE